VKRIIPVDPSVSGVNINEEVVLTGRILVSVPGTVSDERAVKFITSFVASVRVSSKGAVEISRG